MVIADTGFWLALANPRDAYHQAASDWLDRSDEGLATTWPVVTETCHPRIGNCSRKDAKNAKKNRTLLAMLPSPGR